VTKPVVKKLSRPQIDALRYAKGRQLYAARINEGNGNMRRTLLWLLKHELLGWDPIYHGCAVLTALGEQKLTEAREKKLAAVRGTIDDPPSAVRIARRERELAKETKP
jgi:hypothetical protein